MHLAIIAAEPSVQGGRKNIHTKSKLCVDAQHELKVSRLAVSRQRK